MTTKEADYPKLKIDDIRIYRFDIPLKDVFEIATMSIDNAQNVLVQMITNQGVVGWGEASSLRSIVGETQLINFAAAKELKQIFLGKNPLAVAALVEEMDYFLPHNTTIKAAFDMALYDITAQVAGLPLYLYLGGRQREIETDLTIGLCDPSEAGEKATAVREMGFRMIKVKVGTNLQDDFTRLTNIRKAAGSEAVIRIDANQGWDRIAAITNLKAFEEFEVEFCEQPCRAPDLAGMKFVSEHASIPVMADESLFSPYDALNIIQQDAAPYLNIKLTKSGGIYNALKIAHIAEAGARPCMIGCMAESKLGITAATHFATANSNVRFFDLDSHLEHAEDPVEGGITIENGMITLPDTPGIGAVPAPDYLRRLEEIKE
ncbi:MAG TPA: dipeptide epimerase [Caldithrix sp.]|nr:dipeptide epimerase [Caldithrix sp.]